MKTFPRLNNEDPMVTMCRMAVDLKYEDIPAEVAQYAKEIILDTLANMIGGSGYEGVVEVAELVKETGGTPVCPLPFYGGKYPPAQAAMGMGPMPRAIDWAAIHPEAMHNSEHTLPPLLAATSMVKATGKDFITAFVMAQEVVIRIGCAFKGNLGCTYGRSNGHYIFGAVMGVAKLLGLNQAEMENAFGISRSMTQPHDMAAFHPPTAMIKVHHAFISQDAINCCLLAKKGVTGPRDNVLLAPKGYLGFAKWETEPEWMWKDLGEKWEQMNIEIKPFLGCKSGHTAMTGLLQILKEENATWKDIDKMIVEESSLNLSIMDGPEEEKINPKNPYECQFSTHYLLATVAFDGDTSLEAFFQSHWDRPEIKELTRKVTVKEDPALPDWASTIKVVFKNGNTVGKTVLPNQVKGSRGIPFTREDLMGKLRACAKKCIIPLSDAALEKLADDTLNLEKFDNAMERLLLPLTV